MLDFQVTVRWCVHANRRNPHFFRTLTQNDMLYLFLYCNLWEIRYSFSIRREQAWSGNLMEISTTHHWKNYRTSPKSQFHSSLKIKREQNHSSFISNLEDKDRGKKQKKVREIALQFYSSIHLVQYRIIYIYNAIFRL